MKTKRLLLNGVLLATLFVAASVTALAQCADDDPECPLQPPQSQQVNPDQMTTSGETTNVGEIGELNPVDAAMPNPIFIEPVPIDGSINSGQSPVETNEGDASSGPSPSSVSRGAAWAMAAAAAGALAATAPMVLGKGRTSMSQAGGMRSGLRTSAIRPLVGENVPLSGARSIANTPGGSGLSSARSGSRISSASSEFGVQQALGQSTTGEIPAGQGSYGEAHGLGGDRRREDEEDKMLSRATWIPSSTPPPPTEPTETPPPPGISLADSTLKPTETPLPPDIIRAESTRAPEINLKPTPMPPQPPGWSPIPGPDVLLTGEQIQGGAEVGDNLGAVIRNAIYAEFNGELLSKTARTVYAAIRQSAVIGAGLNSNTVRRGIGGLTSGINSPLWSSTYRDRFGAWSSKKITAGVHRATGFIESKVLNPIRQWSPPKLGNSIRARGGIRGLADQAWRGLSTQVEKFRTQLSQPNRPSFNTKLSATSAVGAGLSLVGNTIFNKTGSQGAADAAGVGDLISGGANLIGLRGQIAGILQNGATVSEVGGSLSTLSKVAQVAVKASGVLAIIAGGVTAYTETKKVVADWEDDGRISTQGKMAAVKALGGALGAVGGVLLLTPAAPFGGVFLAISGIISAGTWLAENRGRLENRARALRGVYDNIKTIGRTVVNRVANSIRDRASQIASRTRNAVTTFATRTKRAARQTALRVSTAVSTTLNKAANKVKGFFGKVFARTSPPVAPAPVPTPPRPSSAPRPRQYKSPRTYRPSRRFRPRSTRSALRSRTTSRARYRSYRGR